MENKVFIVASPLETNGAKTILGYDVIYSGIGKINATIAAMTSIKNSQKLYTEIINIGSCGSHNITQGELVKVGQVYQDIDLTPLTSYGETLFEPNSKQIDLDLNSSISCFTTDYFVDKNQYNKYSDYYLSMVEDCSIFDMECYALAKVCKQFGIKFSSYKWISDDGDGSNWEEDCKIGFNKFKDEYTSKTKTR